MNILNKCMFFPGHPLIISGCPVASYLGRGSIHYFREQKMEARTKKLMLVFKLQKKV